MAEPVVTVPSEVPGEREDALPAWQVGKDGWSWLTLFGVCVQICHAEPPQQRMWVVALYVIVPGHLNRQIVRVDNTQRGYVTEDEAKRAAIEYIVPRLHRDLVALDGLLEILPQAEEA